MGPRCFACAVNPPPPPLFPPCAAPGPSVPARVCGVLCARVLLPQQGEESKPGLATDKCKSKCSLPSRIVCLRPFHPQAVRLRRRRGRRQGRNRDSRDSRRDSGSTRAAGPDGRPWQRGGGRTAWRWPRQHRRPAQQAACSRPFFSRSAPSKNPNATRQPTCHRPCWRISPFMALILCGKVAHAQLGQYETLPRALDAAFVRSHCVGAARGTKVPPGLD